MRMRIKVEYIQNKCFHPTETIMHGTIPEYSIKTLRASIFYLLNFMVFHRFSYYILLQKFLIQQNGLCKANFKEIQYYEKKAILISMLLFFRNK